ncbi:hypothetical protein ACHAXS_005829 [Conticribra weissflogii]
MVTADPSRNNPISNQSQNDVDLYYSGIVSDDNNSTSIENIGNGTNDDASSPAQTKSSMAVYNRFENYRLLKQEQKRRLLQPQQQNNETAKSASGSHDYFNGNDAAAAADDDREESNESNLWKHFISPLKPRPCPGNDINVTPSPQQRQPSQQPQQRERQEDEGGANRHTLSRRRSIVGHRPSVFTDLERSETVDRFAGIFVKRMNDALSSEKLAKAWRVSVSGEEDDKGGGSNFGDDSLSAPTEKIKPSDYRAERKLIQTHLTPFVWGSSCMVITLFSMRFGRWYQVGGAVGTGRARTSWTSALRGNMQNAGKIIRKDDVTKLEDLRRNPFRDKTSFGTNYNNSSNTTINATPTGFNASNNPMEGLQTLPVDLAVSILVGISTTLFLSDAPALMKDFSHAPLVSGRSLLSEELCGPFIEEMRRVNRRDYTYHRVVDDDGGGKMKKKEVISYRELWNEENLGEFESLRAVRDFVENCQKRESVARKILVERKSKTGEDYAGIEVDSIGEEDDWKRVSIPSPGVPPSLSLDGFVASRDGHE